MHAGKPFRDTFSNSHPLDAGPSPRAAREQGRLAFSVAEKSDPARSQLVHLRWALVLVFLWFGGMKFTAYEANGISPFIVHSPMLQWLNDLLGVRGASDVIGILELSTATALIIGARVAFASALGAAMSCATYLITITFFFTTPGVAEPTAGGFPAISAPIGQFLLKDVVLLAASLCLLQASLRRHA
jgi:reactive chlorine resistance protein C